EQARRLADVVPVEGRQCLGRRRSGRQRRRLQQFLEEPKQAHVLSGAARRQASMKSRRTADSGPRERPVALGAGWVLAPWIARGGAPRQIPEGPRTDPHPEAPERGDGR